MSTYQTCRAFDCVVFGFRSVMPTNVALRTPASIFGGVLVVLAITAFLPICVFVISNAIGSLLGNIALCAGGVVYIIVIYMLASTLMVSAMDIFTLKRSREQSKRFNIVIVIVALCFVYPGRLPLLLNLDYLNAKWMMSANLIDNIGAYGLAKRVGHGIVWEWHGILGRCYIVYVPEGLDRLLHSESDLFDKLNLDVTRIVDSSELGSNLYLLIVI